MNILESGTWLAGPETEIKKGDQITTPTKGSEMEGFNSKTLDRTFETINFVDAILKPGQNQGTGFRRLFACDNFNRSGMRAGG